MLEREVKNLKNQQLDFDAVCTWIFQAENIKTIPLVKDSRGMLKYNKYEVEFKNNPRLEFEKVHEDKSRHFCISWNQIIDGDTIHDFVKKTFSFKYKMSLKYLKLKFRIYNFFMHSQKKEFASYQKSITYSLQLLIRQVNLYLLTKFYMLFILSSKIIMVFDGDPRI